MFKQTNIDGTYIIESPKASDDRGFFLKAFDMDKFKEQGLESTIVQLNLSHNNSKGTIRGLHYQTEPAGEAKIMRCIRGSIFFAVVDMRKDSPTYLQWEGFTLSEENHLMVYVPKECATGYQALEDNSQALYSSSNTYVPNNENGVRYNDPRIGIDWPMKDTVVVSEKDLQWEDIQV
ncbi:MAG: dTDP-4-dehydrorhamnose 3,5-epimerase [Patescibacteria group bacterium]